MKPFADAHPEIPKYVKVAERFRREIESGDLKPGDRLPSFQELRATLGVSQSTLDRAHQLLEQEALIVRESGRGIFVAHRAAKPSTGMLALLGITGVKGEHAYYARLLNGIQGAAHRLGWEILLSRDESIVASEKVDGVLVYSWKPDQVFRQFPPRIPCVSLLTPAAGVPSVLVNERQGGRIAAEHLIALGHRRIGYIVDTEVYAGRERLAGYREALLAAGIAPDLEWVRHLRGENYPEENDVFGETFSDWGYHRMRGWLKRGWAELGCTALLVQNDDSAYGVIAALQEAGWEVPGDCSVVGYDNAQTSRFHNPALTTVSVPLFEIGERAVELLSVQIRDSAPALLAQMNLPVTVDTRLESRASSAAPVPANRQLEPALT